MEVPSRAPLKVFPSPAQSPHPRPWARLTDIRVLVGLDNLCQLKVPRNDGHLRVGRRVSGSGVPEIALPTWNPRLGPCPVSPGTGNSELIWPHHSPPRVPPHPLSSVRSPACIPTLSSVVPICGIPTPSSVVPICGVPQTPGHSETLSVHAGASRWASQRKSPSPWCLLSKGLPSPASAPFSGLLESHTKALCPTGAAVNNCMSRPFPT